MTLKLVCVSFVANTSRKKNPPSIFCITVKERTQYLIRVLKNSGFLKNGHQIGIFLFNSYKFITIENLTLTTLWNYIYKLKFSSEKFAEMKFSYFLKNILYQLASFPPPLALEAQAIVDVLDMEFCAKLNVSSSATINHD